MKKKPIELNLATLTEKELIKLLDDHEADIDTLMSLLNGLFEMFAGSLKFSGIVVNYASERHNDFLETFINTMSKQHGVSPEKMVNMLMATRMSTSPSTTRH